MSNKSENQVMMHEDSGGGGTDNSMSDQTFDSSLPNLDFNTQELPSSNIVSRKLPLNATQLSTGSNRTILIKPTEQSLIKNPFEVAIAIQETVKDNDKIKEVRTNHNMNLIIIEFKDNEQKLIDEIIKSEKFGKWPANIKRPNTDTIKSGVISPVSVDLDLNIIKRHLKCSSPPSLVVASVERMKKRSNGKWIDSPSVKVSFTGDTLPRSITIFHSFYRVRPYVPEPLQCFKCQRLGHRADSCKGKTRCLLCGKGHTNKVCTLKEEKDFQCANCGGAHKANSRKCEIFSKAKKIEEIRAKENKTYSQARERVISGYARAEFPPLNKHTVYAEVHHPNSPIQTQHQQHRQHILKNSTWGGEQNRANLRNMPKDSATQTTDTSFFEQGFLVKLKECLCDLLDSSILKESKGARKLLIDSALKKTFPQYSIPKDGDQSSSNNRDQNNNKRLHSDNDAEFFDAYEEEDEEGVLSQDGMECSGDADAETKIRRSQRLKSSRNPGKKKCIGNKKDTIQNDSL